MPERTVFFARVWYWVDGTSYTHETFQIIINDGIQHFEALKECIGSLNAAPNPLARLQTQLTTFIQNRQREAMNNRRRGL